MSGIKFIGLAFRKSWFCNPQCLINHKNEIFYSTLYCIVPMFYIHLQHQIIQTVHSYECRQRKIANAQGHARILCAVVAKQGAKLCQRHYYAPKAGRAYSG